MITKPLIGFVKNTSGVVYDPNLVSWWKLDETTGYTVLDSVHSNNGYSSGIPNNNGHLNWCRYLYNRMIQLGNDGTKLINNFSISMWIKIESQVDEGVLWVQENNATGAFDFMLSVTTANKLKLKIGNNSAIANSDLTVGVWTHICFVKGNGFDYVYVNGNKDGNLGISANLGNNPNNGGDVTVGALYYDDGDNSYLSYIYKGYIDEIQFYNKALNQTEVTALYNS
jgi:hypothetical protein